MPTTKRSAPQQRTSQRNSATPKKARGKPVATSKATKASQALAVVEGAEPAAPPRRRSGQHLTAEQRTAAQDLFLAVFGDTANVSAALQRAGIDRRTFYDRWLKHDDAFSARYADALERANDVIRTAIFQRAVLGVKRPLHHNGRVVTERGADGVDRPVFVTDYSDALLMFLAKSRMPEFRDRAAVEVTGKDGGPLVEIVAIASALERKLAGLAERLGAGGRLGAVDAQ